MKENLSLVQVRPQKRNQRDYNLGFKLSVVSQVEKGELTYKQAQRRYGIQGRSTVLKWLRKHGNLDWSKPSLHFMSSTSTKKKQYLFLGHVDCLGLAGKPCISHKNVSYYAWKPWLKLSQWL